ncbi:MAG: glycosyltransferase family 4 protein [Flavobacteriales bacterium]
MKILYYSPHPNVNMAAPSGPGTHIREVVSAFGNSGHTVVRLIAGGETLSSSASIQFKKRGYKKFIPTVLWQTMKDYKLLRFDKMMEQQLLQLIEKEKPDIIYERAYYLMGSGHRAAKTTGMKYVCEINAPYPDEKAEMEGKSLFHHKAVMNEKEQAWQAHSIVVVSSALKKYLIEKTGVNEGKIIITPNAVNPEHIEIKRGLLAEIRNKLEVRTDDKVIGFVGSIFPYHGVDILLEAFVQLKAKGKDNIKLLIVGDGEILNQLKQQAADSVYASDIHFTGNVPHAQVYTYIEAMDITVMARSNWYGSPVKIFEYGAMRKLVIAPDEIPVHDVMVHDQNGYIIKADRQSLVYHLELALNDAQHAETLAANFHQKVMREHTWQHVGDAILNSLQ